jgi:hypothetical protein
MLLSCPARCRPDRGEASFLIDVAREPLAALGLAEMRATFSDNV